MILHLSKPGQQLHFGVAVRHVTTIETTRNAAAGQMFGGPNEAEGDAQTLCKGTQWYVGRGGNHSDGTQVAMGRVET
jgi:hypothetical protein